MKINKVSHIKCLLLVKPSINIRVLQALFSFNLLSFPVLTLCLPSLSLFLPRLVLGVWTQSRCLVREVYLSGDRDLWAPSTGKGNVKDGVSRCWDVSENTVNLHKISFNYQPQKLRCSQLISPSQSRSFPCLSSGLYQLHRQALHKSVVGPCRELIIPINTPEEPSPISKGWPAMNSSLFLSGINT